MSAMEQVLSQALELPRQERAAMARQLLLSLDGDDVDPDYEEAWVAELERRLAKTANGHFDAKDGHDAIADMRRALAQGIRP